MSYLVLVLSLYLAAALDATLLVRAQFAGAAPQLVLLAGLVWICTYRGPRAYVGAALAGLVADLTGTGRLGIGFGLLAGLALTVDALARGLSLDRPAVQAAVVVIATSAIVAVISCVGTAPSLDDMHASALLSWSVITGIYTGIVAWPVCLIVRHQRRHAYR